MVVGSRRSHPSSLVGTIERGYVALQRHRVDSSGMMYACVRKVCRSALNELFHVCNSKRCSVCCNMPAHACYTIIDDMAVFAATLFRANMHPRPLTNFVSHTRSVSRLIPNHCLTHEHIIRKITVALPTRVMHVCCLVCDLVLPLLVYRFASTWFSL